MSLFGILVRCIFVGAIVIVCSVLYIVNAHAEQFLTAEGNCGEGQALGLYQRGSEQKCWTGVTTVYSDGNNSPYSLTASGYCPDASIGIFAYKTASGIYGNCFDSGNVSVPARLLSLRIDKAAAASDSLRITLLTVANVLLLLAATGFGWRMAIRPPSGLME